ncbi:hypothetical protein CEXT_577971, partial [Caerostris extrusa]
MTSLVSRSSWFLKGQSASHAFKEIQSKLFTNSLHPHLDQNSHSEERLLL